MCNTKQKTKETKLIFIRQTANVEKLNYYIHLIYIYVKAFIRTEIFRLLSEYSQRKVSASELAEAIEQLAIHLADFSFNEQDYSVLLRYFSFGLHRLKSYRVRFEQEKNALFAFD